MPSMRAVCWVHCCTPSSENCAWHPVGTQKGFVELVSEWVTAESGRQGNIGVRLKVFLRPPSRQCCPAQQHSPSLFLFWALRQLCQQGVGQCHPQGFSSLSSLISLSECILWFLWEWEWYPDWSMCLCGWLELRGAGAYVTEQSAMCRGKSWLRIKIRSSEFSSFFAPNLLYGLGPNSTSGSVSSVDLKVFKVSSNCNYIYLHVLLD